MKRLFIAAALALAVTAPARAFTEEEGWRVAVQAWTFRDATFFETIDKAHELGLRYVEMYPGQQVAADLDAKTGHGLDDATRALIREKLESAEVTLVNYGVVRGRDEADWRAIFSFAKDMGIETVVSEPKEEELDLVESLCAEYGVNLAIHNHPKPSHYWDPATALATLEGRGRRLGVCADTGHYLRSSLDPVAALRAIGDRLLALHMKDLAEAAPKTRDVVYGTGAGGADAQLQALREIGFKGVITIEYEHQSPDLMQEVGGCVAYLRDWDGSDAEAHTEMTKDFRAVWSEDAAGPADRWTLAEIVAAFPEPPPIPLTDLAPMAVRTGPAGLYRDRAIGGGPLTVGGEIYEHGLSMSASTQVTYAIPENCEQFVAAVGVETGTVVFVLTGLKDLDDPEPIMIEQSPTLSPDTLAQWNFDARLRRGYTLLRLETHAAPGAPDPSSGAWVHAGFVPKAAEE